MRFLIINTDYLGFLDWLYKRQPGLADRSYNDQMAARSESLFGVADFYSRNLRLLGHEAWDLHANNNAMQTAWASENGMKIEGQPSKRPADSLIDSLRPLAQGGVLKHLKPVFRPLVRALRSKPRQVFDILAAQIRHYKPDILLNQAMDEIPDDFIREMKPNVRLTMGQVAAPLVEQQRFRGYDLVISSLPNFVQRFRNEGIPSELSRFAFEPEILSKVPECPGTIQVSFVGSLSSDHLARVRLLETLVGSVDIQIWGQGSALASKESPLNARYRGPAWGVEMYTILRASKMTLNHHIGVAAEYANNMRLFEATGIGTLLVTDRKSNLGEMFEPGKEVVVYGSPEECVEVARHYLNDDGERARIARAGQQRTLRDHNYLVRMGELVDTVRKYL